MKLINFYTIVMLFGSIEYSSLAMNLDDWEGCRNCEALVTLDPAKAQEFTDWVMLFSQMPLKGLVIDSGLESGYALVLVYTWPTFEKNSLDVAKLITDTWSKTHFGIVSIVPVWNRSVETTPR